MISQVDSLKNGLFSNILCCKFIVIPIVSFKEIVKTVQTFKIWEKDFWIQVKRGILVVSGNF
jgi:hypothetical protein